MAAPELVTFGCRLNAYESEVMRELATEAGLDNTVIVNTCAVTAEAERQARQAIRKLRRERPDARIIVTGCAAQTAPAKFAAMPEIDQILGNAEKLERASYTEHADSRILVNDIMSVSDTAGHLIEGFEGRARAFLQIQNGCDHRCTFCIIPYGRGNSRSVALPEIVAQARKLAEAGYQEIVLTGVDITAYGADLPGAPTLGQMTRRLLAQVPAIRRLRLSSLDPVEMDEDLWRLIGDEERLMPHLHMSLQAGDDMVLKRMKRRHSRDDAIGFCDRARALRPDIAFGADLIAGFPTETDEMAANTLALVGELGLVHLHVFPYSAREGTPAARMPQVPMPVRKARAAALREAGARNLAAWLGRQVGTATELLMETDRQGRTPHYASVNLDEPALPGTLVAAEIVDHDGTELKARWR
ncbi:tRNA (N(6)-L-threonylcarbamoyladenosine(37)-C(2))-methylthiotransferase MtaB [Oceanibacterium hippocampi]|uniref:Threonylcarbamoyladenosine tRNA methylthiotransferase MtaB n=1 Tax=Oceanibacterium hippocampi TaxID=745714 RepID=A0A1Y5RD25_9PROT|nr:tRNA (N(6)-L-threonylcarbamoyladenosine(37)-C(2))-methylthiotransferase MtaB [Oceanibacterium hippocampi]SLN14606.1 Threonylcarbamoyladenosine tRNA methylthiotransferase MtaB [Oceanibacterium hippocampi]